MTYTYYTPVQSDEHYLYASELAEKYGVFTLSGRPHIQLVSACLSKMEEDIGQPPFYYMTRFGLKRVYKYGDDFMRRLIKGWRWMGTGNFTLAGGKTYKFKLRRRI